MCYRYTTPLLGFLGYLVRIGPVSFLVTLNSIYQLHVPVQLPCYDFVPVKNLPTQAYLIHITLCKTIGALKADLLPDRDGRFVQNSRTCSPQLG